MKKRHSWPHFFRKESPRESERFVCLSLIQAAVTEVEQEYSTNRFFRSWDSVTLHWAVPPRPRHQVVQQAGVWMTFSLVFPPCTLWAHWNGLNQVISQVLLLITYALTLRQQVTHIEQAQVFNLVFYEIVYFTVYYEGASNTHLIWTPTELCKAGKNGYEDSRH